MPYIVVSTAESRTLTTQIMVTCSPIISSWGHFGKVLNGKEIMKKTDSKNNFFILKITVATIFYCVKLNYKREGWVVLYRSNMEIH